MEPTPPSQFWTMIATSLPCHINNIANRHHLLIVDKSLGAVVNNKVWLFMFSFLNSTTHSICLPPAISAVKHKSEIFIDNCKSSTWCVDGDHHWPFETRDNQSRRSERLSGIRAEQHAVAYDWIVCLESIPHFFIDVCFRHNAFVLIPTPTLVDI